MSKTIADMPADIAEVVKQFANFDFETPKEPAKAEKKPKVEFIREPLKTGEGERDFKSVFGWTPKSVPKDLPVRVFNREDWHPAVRPFIPDSLPNGGLWIWPKEQTEQLLLAMWGGDRTLFHGPTGSGKTALAEAVAFQCCIPLIRTSCHRDMQSTDFLGKDIIKSTDKGPVLAYDWSNTTLAAKHGGMQLIDEAFRSPCLMAIQSLLERDGTLTLPDAASLSPEERKIVPPKGKYWIVLTDNTTGTGDTTGAYNAEVQDLSTLDRITATIFVDYISPADEAKLLVKAVPTLPSDKADTIAKWAEKMRDAFLKSAVMQPISMRATMAIARKFVATGDMGLAIRLSYLSKLGTNCQTVAGEAYHQLTGENV